MTSGDAKSRFKFFFPDAWVLNESEVAASPAEKKQAVEALNKEGVWLEIHCPDASCIHDDGRITIQAVGTESAEEKGIWLNHFCPEGGCEIEEVTGLPEQFL